MTDAPHPAARQMLNRFGTLAILTLLPAVAVFGWRAILVIAGVVASYAVARSVLREPHLPSRRRFILPVDALLVAALLPAESATAALWPIIPSAGILLALLRRVRCLVPALPFDAAVLTLLALHAIAFAGGAKLEPQAVLDRGAIVTGDIARPREAPASTVEPWYERKRTDESEPAAQRIAWAARSLDDYLHDRLRPSVTASSNLDALIRDRLPPLEDLVLLGHPTPLGQASGVFLVATVLWGAHRRTIDWRVPIFAGACAYAALVVLAIPTSFSNLGGNWRFLAAARADVGPATAFTFAHYLAFASPLPIVLGLFASRFDTRPMRFGAMVVWASVFGILSAAATLYLSVPLGALLVAAFVPILARGFDRILARRPMRLPH